MKVPQAMKKQMLQLVHTFPSSEHLAIHRAQQLVLNQFWWRTMNHYGEQHVKTCAICAQTLTSHQPPSMSLHSSASTPHCNGKWKWCSRRSSDSMASQRKLSLTGWGGGFSLCPRCGMFFCIWKLLSVSSQGTTCTTIVRLRGWIRILGDFFAFAG